MVNLFLVFNNDRQKYKTSFRYFIIGHYCVSHSVVVRRHKTAMHNIQRKTQEWSTVSVQFMTRDSRHFFKDHACFFASMKDKRAHNSELIDLDLRFDTIVDENV